MEPERGSVLTRGRVGLMQTGRSDAGSRNYRRGLSSRLRFERRYAARQWSGGRRLSSRVCPLPTQDDGGESFLRASLGQGMSPQTRCCKRPWQAGTRTALAWTGRRGRSERQLPIGHGAFSGPRAGFWSRCSAGRITNRSCLPGGTKPDLSSEEQQGKEEEEETQKSHIDNDDHTNQSKLNKVDHTDKSKRTNVIVFGVNHAEESKVA